MMYVALIVFFLLMGQMIRDLGHAETESEDMRNYYRSEYAVPHMVD